MVVDNLLTGHRSAVHEQATFYEGDIRDKAFYVVSLKRIN